MELSGPAVLDDFDDDLPCLAREECVWSLLGDDAADALISAADGLRRWRRRLKKKTTSEDVSRYADMLAVMGTESRLRIMRLLLSAHPQGLVVGISAMNSASPV